MKTLILALLLLCVLPSIGCAVGPYGWHHRYPDGERVIIVEHPRYEHERHEHREHEHREHLQRG